MYIAGKFDSNLLLNIKYQNDIRWVSQNTTFYYGVRCQKIDSGLSFDTLHRNKVSCFDSPTWYHFDILYCNRTQRGWTT